MTSADLLIIGAVSVAVVIALFYVNRRGARCSGCGSCPNNTACQSAHNKKESGQ